MPNSIDNKIVEMQFDNSNFEKNIKQSIKSLENLNKALELEDATKGFEQMEKAADSIDLSKLERAAEVIEKRFSTAGIAGAALINKTVNGLVDGVVGLGKKVVGLAKTGGISRAMKLEHANFMLNGLIKNEKMVADILNGPVSKAVKGTAFGLDAAANAASQFVASGITGMEELETALTAVSGVAAMTGSSYDEIASIFTTVAGQGKVMTRQLRQIEARGLNAAAAIANFCEITEEEVREMVKQGEVDFQLFSDAMMDAFGDQAKKANETFTGALSNVKAALSRIGAKIATPAFEAMRQVLVDIIGIVDKVNTMLSNTLIKDVLKFIEDFRLMGRTILADTRTLEILQLTIENLGKTFQFFANIIRPVKQALNHMFPQGLLDTLLDFNYAYGSFIDKITLSADKMNSIKYIFIGIFDVIDLILTAVGELFDIVIPGLGTIYDSTDSVATKILKLAGFIGFAIDKFHDFVKEYGVLGGAIEFIGYAFNGLDTVIYGILHAFEFVAAGIAGAAYYIVSAVSEVGKALYNVVNTLSEIEEVQKFFDKIAASVKKIADFVAPAIYMVGAAILFVINVIHELASGNTAMVIDAFNALAHPIKTAAESIKNSTKDITKSMKPLEKKVEQTATKMKVSSETFKDAAGNMVTAEKVSVKAAENMAGGLAVVLPHTDEVQKKIDSAGKTVVETEEKIAESTEKNGNIFITFIEKVKTAIDGLDVKGEVFSVLFGAAIIVTLVNLGKAVGRVSRMFRSFGRIGDSISQFMRSLTAGANAFAIVQIAFAIGLLTASLYFLTKVCDPKMLVIAGSAIVGILIGISVALKILGKVDFAAAMKLGSVGGYLVAFSGAVLILSYAIQKINSVAGNFKQLAVSVGALITVLISLAAVALLLGAFKTHSFKGATTLIAIGASLYLVACSLEKLGQLDLESAQKALPLLKSILESLAWVVLASSLMISPTAGLGMVGVVAAILLMIAACKALTKVDEGTLETVKKIVDMLMTWVKDILLIISIAIFANKLLETAQILFTWLTVKIQGTSSVLSKMFGGVNTAAKRIGNAMAIASIFVAIAGAVLMIVISMEKIANMAKDPAAFKQAAETIGIIGVCALGMVVGIFALAKYLAKNPLDAIVIQNTMNGISLALVSMAACIALTAILPPERIGQALVSMAIVTVFFIALIASLSWINKEMGPMVETTIKTMGAMAILFGSMSIAFAVFGLMPFDAWLKGLSGLALVLLGSFFIVKQLANLGAMTVTAAIGVGLLSVLVLSMAGAFLILDKINVPHVLEACTLLGECLAVLLIACMILTPIAEACIPGAIAVAALEGMLLGLATIGLIASQIDADNIKAVFEKTAEGFVSFCDIMMGVGDVILKTPPTTLLATAAALLFFSQVLPILGAGFLVFSTAALVFGAAVSSFGLGILMLAKGLEILQNLKALDLEPIVEAIVNLGMSCAVLGLASPLIMGFASAALVLSVALLALGVTLAIISSPGLFDTLQENFQKVSDAMDVFANNWQNLLTVAGLIAGFGAALAVVDFALVGLATAVLGLSVALLALSAVLAVVTFIWKQFTSTIERAVEAFKSLGANIVDKIYNGIINQSETLKEAGVTLCDKVVEGFNSAVNENVTNEATYLVDMVLQAIKQEVERRKEESRQAGFDLFDAFGNGMEEAMEINSPSERTKRDVDYAQEGTNEGTEENLDEAKTDGLVLSDTFGGNFFENLVGWFKNAATLIGDFISDPVGFVEKAVSGVFDKMKSGSNFLSEYQAQMSQMMGGGYSNNFDRYLAAGIYQYVPGVGYIHTKSGKPMKDLIGEKSGVYAIDEETGAIEYNTGAVGDNTSAKGKNKKANDSKTKAIKEETDAVEEEGEATEETSEDIRAMAEQIFVVTKAYNELNHYQGVMVKDTGRIKKYQKATTAMWSGAFESVSKLKEVYKSFANTIGATVKKSNKGVYAFGEGFKNIDKMYKASKIKGISKSLKTVNEYVMKTGNKVARVYGDNVKVFYKVGNKVDKIFMNATKKINKIPKLFKKALSTAQFFAKDMTSMINAYDWSDEPIQHIRMIEESFGKVKFKNLTEGVQNYLKNVLGRFKELDPAISHISKMLGGTFNVFNKNSRVVPAVTDALVSLGAVLYNGSEAANDYATQIARLEFLYEHGEVSWEELQEAKIDYFTRIKEALVEYKNQLDETYMSEIDFFSAFDKKELAEGTNILNNLFSNISGYFMYGQMLEELSRRVPALAESGQLVKQFADGGVENFGKLQAVLQLSNQELNAYIYGIKVLNKTQTELSNKAFAAVANATSYASKREQARTKDVAKKTTKYSYKLRKAMEDDMEALAQATTEYNNLFKKEEKEYLKNLTKSEKKLYKKKKKELKQAKKDYNAERKKSAEKARIENVKEAIKSYSDYLRILKEYANDSAVITEVTKNFSDAMNPLINEIKTADEDTQVFTEDLITFAETLNETGEEGLTYFEELAKRVKNFREEIETTLGNVNMLTTAFGKTQKITISEITKNAMSNVAGDREIARNLELIKNRGYNTYVLNNVKSVWDSDRSQAEALLQTLVAASQDEVNTINSWYEVAQETAQQTSKAWTSAYTGLSRSELQTKSDTKLKAWETAYSKLLDVTSKIQNAESEIDYAYDMIDTLKEKASMYESWNDLYMQASKKERKKLFTNDELATWEAWVKKYGGWFKGAYYAPAQGVGSTTEAAFRADIARYQAELEALKTQRTLVDQELATAAAERNAANQALSDYDKRLATIKEQIKAEADLQAWFDKEILSYKAMKDELGKSTIELSKYNKIVGSITSVIEKLKKTVKGINFESIYNTAGNFEKIKEQAQNLTNALPKGISNLTDGIMAFGQSLVDATDDAEDFYETLTNGLLDYQASLKSTMKSSSDFFSEFSGFSDKNKPLTATKYLEYADSQIKALQTWQENLKKLTDLGLDKELVENFASQGLSSYEQVNAWANATAKQIGEYNKQWKDYQAEVEKASETALASIAASWSEAGKELSSSMIDYFNKEGADRLKEAGTDASEMIVTGLKNGLTNAMPAITEAITSTDSTTQIATKVGNAVGAAINQGVVQSVANSVEDVVNSVIEKFKMAVDSINSYVEETLNDAFNITIHVNASEIDMAVARMNSAIYGINADAMTTGQSVTSSISNRDAAAATVVSGTAPTQEVSVTYTQNNYSPKALSRTEIYRQTKNQLSTIESVVAATGG